MFVAWAQANPVLPSTISRVQDDDTPGVRYWIAVPRLRKYYEEVDKCTMAFMEVAEAQTISDGSAHEVNQW